MDKQNWDDIHQLILSSTNDQSDIENNLHFSYDGGFNRALNLVADKNDSNISDKVSAWIYKERHKEADMRVLRTRVSMALNKDEINEQGKIFTQGILALPEINTFATIGNSNEAGLSQKLFKIAIIAIQRFQENPSAIILFPNLVIPDSRIIEGWYGPLWSLYNAYTLATYFREINPWFNIRLVTTSENKVGDYFERNIAFLFTYNDIYSMFL